MMIFRYLELVLTLLLAGALCGQAGVVGQAAAAGQTPEKLVRSTSDAILEFIKNQDGEQGANAGAINERIAEIVEPVIDFEYFAKSILGKHWRKATDKQRTRFVSEFRGFLIRAQTKPLTDFANSEVRILSTRERDENNVAVLTELDSRRGKAPVPITYLFRKRGAEWKLINVSIEGLNLIKNFRTSFSEDIAKSGLDALIERLAKSNLESAQ